MIDAGDWLQVIVIGIGFIGAVASAVYMGGRWTQRIENGIEGVRSATEHLTVENKADHERIISRMDNHPAHEEVNSRLDEHHARLSRLEGK